MATIHENPEHQIVAATCYDSIRLVTDRQPIYTTNNEQQSTGSIIILSVHHLSTCRLDLLTLTSQLSPLQLHAQQAESMGVCDCMSPRQRDVTFQIISRDSTKSHQDEN